jgi:hypothetical protein
LGGECASWVGVEHELWVDSAGGKKKKKKKKKEEEEGSSVFRVQHFI